MEISEQYLRAFFGKNAGYYLEKWRLRQQGTAVTFNPSAFLGGLFWFAYRRMYRVLAVWLVLIFAETLLEELFLPGTATQARTLGANLVAASLYGALGNLLYLRYAEGRIRKVMAQEESEEAVVARLRARGGTSWRFLWVLGAGLLLFVGWYVWMGQQPAA